MDIVERIVSEGLAENSYAAQHIAEGLHLAQLKTEEEQIERVRLYRQWRKAGWKSQNAYWHAILGDPAPKPFGEK